MRGEEMLSHGATGKEGGVPRGVARLVACLVATATLREGLAAASEAEAAESTASVIIDDAFEERALGSSLALFEDTTAALTLDDVRKREIAERFVPSRVESPSLGYTKSTWWARFELDDRRTPGGTAAEEPLVVTLAYAQTDEARFACEDDSGRIVVRARAGDHVPHEELPSAYREPSFEVPRTARTCWIDVHTSGSVQFPVTLRSFDRFVEHRVEDTKLQFLYFGALLVMIAYNALVALAAGSRAYAAYTAFLVAHGLVQVLLAGVAPRWLGALVTPTDRLIPLATSLTGLSSLVFTMILLDVRERLPRMATFARVLGIYLGVHAALSLLLPYDLGVKSVLVVEPLWAGLLVVIGVARATEGARVAFYYLGAWAAFIVGAIVYLGRVTGVVATNALTANAQQLGSAVEFVLLSFALADRIKALQEESQLNAERAREATELALAEQSRLNLELQRLDKLKDSFLANTSHELRTPLNGILGLVETTLSGAVGDVAPLVKRNLKLVRASGRRLATLVNDILDFSALRERTVRLHERPLGLASMVELALQTLAPLASDKHVFLANEVSEHIGAIADENRLQQILTNLIGNAIKFTSEGEITVRAQIIGARVHVSVHDTGVGIAPEDHERIFESFEQGDGSTTREFSGTGLGLAVTKKLVELHGGTLRVKSEVGVGSVFTFDLAVCDVPEDDAPASHVIPQGILSPSSFSISGAVLAAVPPSNGIRVLVADDEPVNREMLAQHLMAQGFTVIQAQDGVAALAAIRDERPDLVLLDVMMPKKNGYEVLAEIRPALAASELPVLLLTAKAQESDLKRGFLLGASDYVLKPVSFVELDARIAHHTRLVRAQRELRDHATDLEGRVERRTTELREALDAIATDLEEAKLFQQLALKTPPSLAGLGLAVRWLPLGVVSGDFYDFCELSDGRLRVLVADATGHGVQAALRTMVIKTAYDAIKTSAATPADCLRELNAALLAAYPALEAKTDAVCVDLAKNSDGSARVTASIAGVMYVLFDDGEFRGEVRAPGFSLGYMDDLPFVNGTIDLGPEARLCLFSDGLTEQFDDRERAFEFDAIEQSLAEGGDVEAVADRIMAAWHVHRAEVPPADDLTLVVIGARRAPAA